MYVLRICLGFSSSSGRITLSLSIYTFMIAFEELYLKLKSACLSFIS
jgi:hypothetical protein